MADEERVENEHLEPLIGEWSMAMVMPGEKTPNELPDIGARVTFEWMGKKAFVVQCWTVPIPEAPGGIAVIRWDDDRETFLQHYFDERGVARVYEMTFEGSVWRLQRTKEDYSSLEFSQRFTGHLSSDGKRIDGIWEIALDHKTWKKDFDLIYTRVD